MCVWKNMSLDLRSSFDLDTIRIRISISFSYKISLNSVRYNPTSIVPINQDEKSIESRFSKRSHYHSSGRSCARRPYCSNLMGFDMGA